MCPCLWIVPKLLLERVDPLPGCEVATHSVTREVGVGTAGRRAYEVRDGAAGKQYAASILSVVESGKLAFDAEHILVPQAFLSLIVDALDGFELVRRENRPPDVVWLIPQALCETIQHPLVAFIVLRGCDCQHKVEQILHRKKRDGTLLSTGDPMKAANAAVYIIAGCSGFVVTGFHRLLGLGRALAGQGATPVRLLQELSWRYGVFQQCDRGVRHARVQLADDDICNISGGESFKHDGARVAAKYTRLREPLHTSRPRRTRGSFEVFQTTDDVSKFLCLSFF